MSTEKANRISSYYDYEERAMQESTGRHQGGAQNLWKHVVELCELQTRLLVADLKEAKSRVKWPIVGLAVGLVLALSSGPVLVAGLGLLLQQLLEWSLAASLLTMGVIVTLLGLGLAYAGFNALLSAGAPLARSEEEFRNNLTALANAVRQATGGEEGQAPGTKTG